MESEFRPQALGIVDNHDDLRSSELWLTGHAVCCVASWCWALWIDSSQFLFSHFLPRFLFPTFIVVHYNMTCQWSLAALWVGTEEPLTPLISSSPFPIATFIQQYTTVRAVAVHLPGLGRVRPRLGFLSRSAHPSHFLSSHILRFPLPSLFSVAVRLQGSGRVRPRLGFLSRLRLHQPRISLLQYVGDTRPAQHSAGEVSL